MSSYSLIEYFGGSNDGKCGYCKKTGNYNSHGFWAHMMNVEDYQNLIDRNWRRSGQYLYIPDNKNTCCPMYTIKCDALNFKLSRSHKKIIKKVNKFLRDGTKEKNRSKISEPQTTLSTEPVPSKEHTKLDPHELTLMRKNKNTSQKPRPVDDDITMNSTDAAQKVLRPMKKKIMRLQRKKAKLAAKGLTLADVPRRHKNIEKTLEDRLGEEPKNGKHKLQVCEFEILRFYGIFFKTSQMVSL